jgi:hypothetical protein
VQIRALKLDEQFKKLISSGERTSSDYVFNQLLKNFMTENGVPFIHIEDTKSKYRALTFTPKFYSAVQRYVRLFVSDMGEKKLRWQLNNTKPEKLLAYLKMLISYQDNQYYPLWKKLARQLAAATEHEDLPAKTIADEILNCAPYWSLLMTILRKELGDDHVSNNTSGVYRGIVDAMRGADPKEIAGCLEFLSKPGGCGILRKSKPHGQDVYSLDLERCAKYFIEYMDSVLGLHEEMLESLARVK